MGVPIRVLFVEDSEDDVALLLRELRSGGYDPSFERVDTATAMKTALDNNTWDIVISDYTMPHFRAPDALAMLRRERDFDLPFIIVSGSIGEDIAVACMKAGAHDYFMKGNLARLSPTIDRELQDVANRRTQRKAEQALRESEEYNKNILISLPYAIMVFNDSGKVEYVNPIYLRDFHLQEEAIIGKDLFGALPIPKSEKEKIKKDVESFLSGKTSYPREVKFDQKIFLYHLFYLLKDTVEAKKYGLIIKDITFEKKSQEQLIQSQKMAGMGIMAAGIAHELNNPLAIILGKAEMILEEEIPSSVRKYAEDTIKFSKKASEIVKGVMFYSRSASAPGVQWKVTHLNDQLKEAIKISKLLPDFDNVEVVTDYQDIPPIRGNSGEIQQLFTNLMINAAQAMKGKGHLYIKSQYEKGSVVVTLRDTGPGIKKEHLDKLFTPFFTTKDPGKGTGLGLSILHKIINNHGGSISVESEEGKGAAFIVRLPKAIESADQL